MNLLPSSKYPVIPSVFCLDGHSTVSGQVQSCFTISLPISIYQGDTALLVWIALPPADHWSAILVEYADGAFGPEGKSGMGPFWQGGEDSTWLSLWPPISKKDSAGTCNEKKPHQLAVVVTIAATVVDDVDNVGVVV